MTFTSSKWIWTAQRLLTPCCVPEGFTPPLGKALIAAEILIMQRKLQSICARRQRWIGTFRVSFAHRFCVDLLPAIMCLRLMHPPLSSAGLLATILLNIPTVTTDTLMSDSTWRVNKGLPAGFQQLSFDDTLALGRPCLRHTAQGDFDMVVWSAFPQTHLWSTLSRADWVWTDVIPASGTIPASSRAFSAAFFIPAPGQVPTSAPIIIAADNEYTLYVNGVTVGMGSTRKVAQRYTVNFANPGSEVVLTVLATNNAASPAGLISAMEINMQPAGRTSCTAGAFVLTDAQWKSPKGAIPAAFEQTRIR
ncbi:hypothetical protein B0H14DRAFT_3722684 [Mycena olivaceomarginata]|nr:hypothetical protein B0H14DRAFT_3722684 [Mycena olivaceomarginata]